MPTNQWPDRPTRPPYRPPQYRYRDYCAPCGPGIVETGPPGQRGRPGPVGPPGIQGPIGPQGLPAYALALDNVCMPGVGNTVSLKVDNPSLFSPGQTVFVQGAGYFTVQAVDPATGLLTLVNTGAPENAPVGTTIYAGSTVIPVGMDGKDGLPAWTYSTANFNVPALGSAVSVTVENTRWMAIGELVWVQGLNGASHAGLMRVSRIIDNQTVMLDNIS